MVSNPSRRRRWCAWTWCALLATTPLVSCSESTSPEPASDVDNLLVDSGNRQLGGVGQRLPQSIKVLVLNRRGHRIAGVPVHWSTPDSGLLEPAVSTSDQNGEAEAFWTLGPKSGVQHAHAAIPRFPDAEFEAIAGSEPTLLTPITPLIPLAFKTPDGSGQTVHPDFAAVPKGWSTASEYLAITPYRDGNPIYENPMLFARTTESLWDVPDGVQSPLVTPGEFAYLSDPDVVFEPDLNELWIYYREVGKQNIIRLLRSPDGVHFNAPQTVVSGPNHTIVSPAVVRREAGAWLMWSVNATEAGCSANTTTVELRRSANGLDWSDAQTVDLVQPGFSVWHIDVQWIPSRSEYWALYAVKPSGTCNTPAVFLATSPDGVKWTTYPSPVLMRGAIGEFYDVVYRSTFAYDSASDVVRLWHSGAVYRGTWVWSSAFQKRSRIGLFSAIGRSPSETIRASLAGSTAPPLRDAP